MGDTATWVGVGVSLLVGIAGLLFGMIANGRAKQANELAAEANRHSESAIAEAKEANRVAVAANKLSEESNSIVRSEASKANEDWLVEWTIEWNAEHAAILLTNVGRDEAHEVSVTINGIHLNDVWRAQNPVTRSEAVRLEYPHLLEQRAKFNVNASNAWSNSLRHGFVGTPVKWSDSLDVFVSWRTGLGKPQHQRVEFKIS